jgi:ParB family chromosome partitioning protein
MTKKRVVPEMRGVSAFLSSTVEPVPSSANSVATNTIAIAKISLPSKQPRRFFDPEKLEQLAESIRQHGILEPILVRSLPGDVYELVAGERRYRAAQLAGLKEVPIVARELSDQEALQFALIENLQREDLNPVEETEGMLDLLTLKLGCSQEDILDALAQMATAQKKRIELSGNVSRWIETIAEVLDSMLGLTPESFRTSRLPLLKLPAEVLTALREGKIEFTKARAIARVKDEDQRSDLLKQTIAENLPLAEIKVRVKENKPELEQPLEKIAAQRLGEIGKRLQKSDVWSDRKKRDRITKLLDELDRLTASGD